MEWSLQQAYDAYPRIEAAFEADLDRSLDPRAPDLLYDLVAGLDLPAGAAVVDVGCGEGRHAIELARRFGFVVTGIDPVPRHIEVACAAGGSDVAFVLGRVERLPVSDSTVDLIWCRDVLIHVADLDRAYAHFHRVLKPGGRAIVYQMFLTDRIEPEESAWLCSTLGVVPASADPASAEAAMTAAGLRIDDHLTVGSEWGEWAQEHDGKPGRKLLHAARLLRARDTFVQRYGPAAYDIMLADCLWHVYAMIGKLTRRVYLLSV
jgi:ubiquinone/menaquinone biosynthesis C-methylase UbiE